MCLGWLERGLFEHKCALDFFSLTFVHAKWTKSKTTFVQIFNEVWQYFKTKLKVILQNFVLIHLVHDKIFRSARISQILTVHYSCLDLSLPFRTPKN